MLIMHIHTKETFNIFSKRDYIMEARGKLGFGHALWVWFICSNVSCSLEFHLHVQRNHTCNLNSSFPIVDCVSEECVLRMSLNNLLVLNCIYVT